MGSWPSRILDSGEKEKIVEVHFVMPYRVVDDGKSLLCAHLEWNHEEQIYEIDDDSPPTTFRNVDTIIFCTGYTPSSDFLDQDLRVYKDVDSLFWKAPKDFRMKPNAFTPDLGEIQPTKELSFSGNILPGLYRTLLISNPKMMFIMDFNSEYPLLQLEAEAWLCLAFCCGNLEVPSKEKMEERIHQQMLDEMNVAYLRWSMDQNYYQAMFALGGNHWSDDYSDPRTNQVNEEYYAHYLGIIASMQKDAGYPIDFGSYGDLNELGQKLVKLGAQNIYMRHTLDSDWMTFRDVDAGPFVSAHTGQKSLALPKPWVELSGDDADQLFENL